jgi:hypothetical protein
LDYKTAYLGALLCFELQELHGTCEAMQHRLVELVGKLANDEVTAELLRVNDELNNLFLR